MNNLKIVFTLSFFLWVVFPANSQSDSLDLSMLKEFSADSNLQDTAHDHIHEATISDKGVKPGLFVMNGLFIFYRLFISESISAGCIYDMSCSNFGKEAMHEYGIIKGFFLAIDRVSRCTSLAKKEIPSWRFLPSNLLVDDLPEYYRLRP